MKLYVGKKMQMMVSAVVIVMLAIGLAGCSQKIVKDPAFKDITAKIESIGYVADMPKGDPESLKDLYDLEADQLEEFALYYSMINVQTSEIALFKVKDTKDIEGVKAKVEKRIADKAAVFEHYLPEQYDLIQNHILKVQGNYILLIISEDAKEIENAFDKSFEEF